MSGRARDRWRCLGAPSQANPIGDQFHLEIRIVLMLIDDHGVNNVQILDQLLKVAKRGGDV